MPGHAKGGDAPPGFPPRAPFRRDRAGMAPPEIGQVDTDRSFAPFVRLQPLALFFIWSPRCCSENAELCPGLARRADAARAIA